MTAHEKYRLLKEYYRRKSRESFLHFAAFINPGYKVNFHHKIIADELTDFLFDPEKKKLMLLVPPQHGKSELASRLFPAWAFGVNPDLRIAGVSYSIDLPRSFNREIQQYLDSPDYSLVFPETKINSTGARVPGQHARNTNEFHIVGHKGAYKAVGVGGGLTGFPVDLGIIDDPFKDKKEAYSGTIRKGVWDWYTGVYIKRLSNHSKTVLIMTRWHEDDLAGRLLKKEDDWTVIKLQAIKTPRVNHPEDPRETGEALWPERHSLQKLLQEKDLDPSGFEALNQQNPTIEGGNKIKDKWFVYCDGSDVPQNVNWDLWIDGAYTKSTEGDPTGFMIAGFDAYNDTMYVKHASHDWLEMPEALEYVEEYARTHLSGMSSIYIEPKATGHSLVQLLRKKPGLYPSLIEGKLVQEGKPARAQVAAVKFQAKKIVFVRGGWNDEFKNQLTGFPNASHDEYVDLIGYATDHYFDEAEGPEHE